MGGRCSAPPEHAAVVSEEIGKLDIFNDIKTVDVDCASCDFSFDLLNTPEKMNFDFASGAFRIVLPSDASFTAQSDSLAGKVTVNGFASISKIGNKTVVGSGASSFQFDMMAGSISITARVSN